MYYQSQVWLCHKIEKLDKAYIWEKVCSFIMLQWNIDHMNQDLQNMFQ